MRIFVGIALDAASRAACADAQSSLRRTGFDAQFDDPDKFHVTLAFLGNVDDARHEGVVAAMERTAAHNRGFDLTLDKTGAFPSERRPRIVYVGARDQGAGFRTLCGALRSAYAELGFTFHDDAVAHVTIARVKAPNRPMPSIEVARHTLQVAELTLFESTFDKEQNTSRYVVNATARLLPCVRS